MADWQMTRGPKQCAVSGEPFEPGEAYYSALTDEGDTFRRLDFSAAVWPEQVKDTFFSFWRTRQPEENDEPRKRIVDTAVIYDFFTRLEDADRVEKLTFRYLLALILVRKRFLRLEDIVTEEEKEYLAVYDRRAERRIKVLNPEASVEALGVAQQELGCIFDMDFDDQAEPSEDEAIPTDDEAEAEEE